MDFDTTIAAVSTPHGRGGISIIRISGKDALKVADKVFKNKNNKTVSDAKSHTILYGFAVRENGSEIDQVLCSVMKAPRTYTGEDVAEISCHGGIISTREILSACLNAGARLAEPGEFTKRAFLNGKMDLTQAESVIDIINAPTKESHSVSVHQLKGALSERIGAIRENLLELTSHLQVLIDFADEDLEPLTDKEYFEALKKALDDVQKLIATSDRGRIIKEGVNTAIVGKPNAGKSSLLNLLYGGERAIVTDIEGTTRDAIEENISFGGVLLNVSDTAGIRQTEDIIEKIGVEKSKEILAAADLVIFVTDATKPLDDNDRYIMESVKDKNTIVLINKSEIGSSVDKKEFKHFTDRVIEFSVKEKKGVAELEDMIKKMFGNGDISSSDDALITSIRHKDALVKAQDALKSAIEAIEGGIEANMTFIDIENAISALGEITGQTVAEEIVDRIFHSFCVGK